MEQQPTTPLKSYSFLWFITTFDGMDISGQGYVHAHDIPEVETLANAYVKRIMNHAGITWQTVNGIVEATPEDESDYIN